MVNIGGKIYRNLQEQVGYNSEQIKKIFSILDGIDYEDHVVVIDDLSTPLTEEEMAIVAEPVSFLVYQDKLYFKDSSDSDKIYFSAVVNIVGTDVITISEFQISVNIADGVLAQLNSTSEIYSKTRMDEKLANVEDLISNIGNASPKGVYATLADLQTAYPTGTDGIYVVTDDGHWYYWDGLAWTDGGTYQATAIAESSISAKELDTDVANCIAGNRPLITRQGGYLSKTDGTYKYANLNHSISSKMLDCEEGDIFFYKGYGVADAGSVLFYNGSTYVSYAIYNSISGYTKVVIPSGINKVIFSSFSALADPVIFDLIKVNIRVEMLDDNIKKVLNVFTEQLGFLNRNNGNYSYPESWHSISSQMLDCEEGDIFFYKGKGESATASALFYNGSTIVSYYQVVSTTGYTKVVIPSGVNKVIFSSYEALANPVIFDLVKFNIYDYLYNEKFLPISSDRLFGKKLVCCGDSFTKGGDLPDGSSYPYLIANKNNMNLTLLAVNGGFIHYDIDLYPNACFTNTGNTVNYTNIPADADYITIAYGLNEGSVPLGDSSSSDNTTIWGAYNEVLGWIIANRPNAKVGIIANDAWFTETMRNTLKEIASFWGVSFLDLKEYGKPLLIGGKYASDGPAISATAISARNTQYQMSALDEHPNADGHIARSSIIEEWLRGM